MQMGSLSYCMKAGAIKKEEYDKEFLLLRHTQLQTELEEVKLKLNQT